ncbi:MAG: hypothetical protein ACRET4_16895 [Steroidobacteraceae bacterium]
MIDLNHGSGFQYEAPTRSPGVATAINAAIDDTLASRNRAQPPRHYVSPSGLGRECLRQIQYDYLAVSKDEGRDFDPATLRIFEAGHRAEDIVAAWLRAAGFDLRTQRKDGGQFGFASLGGRFRGHIDGCLVAGPAAIDYPALWENKALGASSWKEVVKKGVAIARPTVANRCRRAGTSSTTTATPWSRSTSATSAIGSSSSWVRRPRSIIQEW